MKRTTEPVYSTLEAEAAPALRQCPSKGSQHEDYILTSAAMTGHVQKASL